MLKDLGAERMREFVREALVSDAAVAEGAAVYRAENDRRLTGWSGQLLHLAGMQSCVLLDVFRQLSWKLVHGELLFPILGEFPIAPPTVFETTHDSVTNGRQRRCLLTGTMGHRELLLDEKIFCDHCLDPAWAEQANERR